MAALGSWTRLLLLLLTICHTQSNRNVMQRHTSESAGYYSKRRFTTMESTSTCNATVEMYRHLVEVMPCKLTQMETGKRWNTMCERPKVKVFEFYEILRNISHTDFREAYLYLHQQYDRVGLALWLTRQAKDIMSNFSCQGYLNWTAEVAGLAHSATHTGCILINITHVVDYYLRLPYHRNFSLVVKTTLHANSDGDNLKPFLQVISNDQDSEDQDFCVNGELAAKPTPKPRKGKNNRQRKGRKTQRSNA